jgi:hypothetical protein
LRSASLREETRRPVPAPKVWRMEQGAGQLGSMTLAKSALDDVET